MKKRWANKKNREAQSKKLKESWSDLKLREKQSEMVKRKHAANPEKWAKSKETRKKISESLTGKPHPHTKEQDEKIAEANRGKKRSAKTRARISAAKKGQTYRPRSKKHTRNQSRVQTGKPKGHGESVSRGVKKHYRTPAGKAQAKKHSEHLSKMYQDNPEKFQKWIEAGLSSTSRKWCDTEPELQMAAILDELGIGYVKQYREPSLPKPHRYHKWDFRVAGAKVLIEVDGCWWHGCAKHATASRRRELKESVTKQSRRDRVAEEQGWTVLRFWEHNLNENRFGVLVVVDEALNEAYEARASA
jgi:DNA mismatch endonuclease (patch repair protein)